VIPVEERLAAYAEAVDAAQRPVGLDEIIEWAERGRVAPSSPRRVSAGRVRLVVAAAAVTLVVVGVAILLSRSIATRSPIGSTTTTTSSSTTSTTSIPSATTTVPTADGIPVPGLGTFRWTSVTGTPQDLPRTIVADPEGGFIGYDRSRVWTSEDLVVWAAEDPVPVFEGVDVLSFAGDWAIGSTDDPSGQTLFHRSADVWTEVSVPAATTPAVDGIDWTISWGMPVVEGPTAVLPLVGYGAIAWGGDLGPEGDLGLTPVWDAESQTLRVYNRWSDPPVATLRMAIVDDVVQFIDTTTGEVVHEIVGAPGFTAEQIRTDLIAGSLTLGGIWRSIDDGPFEFHEVPWHGTATIVAMPGGGFAAFVFQVDASGSQGIVSAGWWTSTDGVEWVDRGEPGFVSDAGNIETVRVAVVGDHFEARAAAFDGSGLVGWASVDGVTWEPMDEPLAYDAYVVPTDFGYVASAFAFGNHVWVSVDGEQWTEVPIDGFVPDAAMYGSSGGLGDLVWVSTGNLRDRAIWIGRFDA